MRGDRAHQRLQELCFDHGFLSPEDMLRAWREEGLTVDGIITRLRHAVSPTSIYELLRRYGIPTANKPGINSRTWRKDMKKHFIKKD
jgi:hypothetical protein